MRLHRLCYPMLTFEQILADARLSENQLNETTRKTYKVPEAVLYEDLELSAPADLEHLNAILLSLSLPTFTSSDSAPERVHKLAEIVKRHPFDEMKFSSEEALERALNARQCVENERVCDAMEIELANSHIEKLPRYNNKSIKELERMLEEMRSVVKANIPSSTLSSVLEEIRKGGKSAVRHLLFLKSATEGAYVKEKARKMLQESEELMCKVLLTVMNQGVTEVTQIERSLGVDRVSLLKTIYNLCSKKLLVYCRHTDTVRFMI